MNAYWCTNILLVLACILLLVLRALNRRLAAPLSYRHLRQMGGFLALAALLLPAWSSLSHEASLVPAIAEAWSAPSMHSAQLLPPGDYHLTTSVVSAGTAVSLDLLAEIFRWLLPLSLVTWSVWVLGDVVRARRILQVAHAIHRAGRAWILVSPMVRVPFACWTPARSAIVLPSTLLEEPINLRIAIRHEAQHHRQGDAFWIYFLQFLKGAFLWNPAAHILVRELVDLQELACDEAVLRRSRIAPSEYCRCLTRVAACAIGSEPAVLPGMASRRRGALLARVQAALSPPQRHAAGPMALAVCIGLSSGMVLTATAFGGVIADQRISWRQAENMAGVARQTTRFPLVMNDEVAQQLNRLLGTRDGRAYLKAVRGRLQGFRPALAREMDDHGLPRALLALPLVESGYRNLPPVRNPARGAGLWMFVAATARHYGLRVEGNADERLDISRESAAAARHAGGTAYRVRGLVVGIARLQRGSRPGRGRNPRDGLAGCLETGKAGYGNDADYLASAMAAITILGNPAKLDDL